MAAEGRKRGGGGGDRDRDDGRRPPMARDRSPLGGDKRDPYRMPPGRGRSPVPLMEKSREPFRDDPFRRPPPGEDRYPPPPPSRPGDPYRRGDPYGDRRPPHDDPFAPPPAPFVPPFDCTIVSMTKNQREYAEVVERRIRAAGLETDFIILSDEAMLAKAMDDITLQKIPYAVVCSQQNESHRSLTVNILHGTPQEHRNMPIEDAVNLLNRNFEKFKEEMRAKLAPPGARPKGGPSVDFVPPHPELAYLLHLMADKQELSLNELDQVFTYVQARRNREREARGLPTETTPAAAPEPVPAPAATMPKQSDKEKIILEQQAQLQAKILSILQGPATATPAAAQAPSLTAYNSASVAQLTRERAQNALSQLRGAQPSGGGINFDSPSVQRALDNLIQSGPNLLRNISVPGGQGQAQDNPYNRGPSQSQESQYNRGAPAYRY